MCVPLWSKPLASRKTIPGHYLLGHKEVTTTTKQTTTKQKPQNEHDPQPLVMWVTNSVSQSRPNFMILVSLEVYFPFISYIPGASASSLSVPSEHCLSLQLAFGEEEGGTKVKYHPLCKSPPSSLKPTALPVPPEQCAPALALLLTRQEGRRHSPSSHLTLKFIAEAHNTI